MKTVTFFREDVFFLLFEVSIPALGINFFRFLFMFLLDSFIKMFTNNSRILFIFFSQTWQ